MIYKENFYIGIIAFKVLGFDVVRTLNACTDKFDINRQRQF